MEEDHSFLSSALQGFDFSLPPLTSAPECTLDLFIYHLASVFVAAVFVVDILLPYAPGVIYFSNVNKKSVNETWPSLGLMS